MSKLVALLRLQEIDLELDTLNGAASEGARRLAELDAETKKARDAADAERGRLADSERSRRQLEQQIVDDKDKLKKWEARLPQLKTQREFAALDREIAGLRHGLEAADEQLKSVKGSADELKLAVQQKESELLKREQAQKAVQNEVNANDEGRGDKLAQLKARREGARTEVDAKLLAAYESLRRKRAGKAIAAVVGFTCTACNRKVAPAMVHRLMAGAIEPCSNCLRLLYAENPPVPAKG